jgi:WD40 repeat protein
VKTPALLEPRASVVLDDYVADLAWSPDGLRLAIAGGEGRVFLATHSPAAKSLAARQLGDHGMGALAVAWQPKGETVVTSGQDNAIAFWDGVSGDERRRLRPAMAWTEHLAWSPDGARLASAAGKALSLWSPDGEPVHKFDAHAGAIAAIGWDKPGRDLAAATNGALVIHRIEGTQFATRQYKWPASCQTVSFSPNGRVIASGMQDGSLHFWYLSSGKDSQMRGYPGKVHLTSWSGDSRWLASNAGNEVVCWDFSGKGPEGSKPAQLSGHTDRVECLAFQPGGPYLVSAGRDWRLTLWWPGKAKQAIDAHLTDSEPSCVRWSPDGRHVAVGERKGKLTVFELVKLG